MQQSFNISIRRWSRSLLGKLFIAFCLFCYNLSIVAFALPTFQRSASPDTSLPDVSFTSSDLGIVGPFSFGAGYGSLNSYSFNAQYTKKLNEAFALSGLVEYGDGTYRIGGTLGVKVTEHDLFKVSAERFNQLLPFAFATGDIDESMSQNAYGARYRHAIDNQYLKEFDLGVYYANTPNESLDPIIFSIDDTSAINYRHIAGATSQGLDASSALQVTDYTEISAQLYYDKVQYDTKYTPSSSADAQGFGGGLGIKQLFSERVVVSAVGNVRKLYNTYSAGISWMPQFLGGSEISLLGQRIITHNETPNSNIFGLQFGYIFGVGGGGARYELASLNVTSDVGEWTAVPAIYMDQVLAISDETIALIAPLKSGKMLTEDVTPSGLSLSPASGPIEGGTSVVITGTDFSDVTAVKFGDLDATEFSVDNPTQITALSPPATEGIVAVTLLKSTEKSPVVIEQFTYETLPVTDDVVPTVTVVAPNAGPIAGGISVVLTGTSFTGATAVKFGLVPATSFTVNSATQITAVSPAVGAGVVNITVTTAGGTSATSAANQFTYQLAPIVTSISPNAGVPTGNTTVTVNGTNFLGTSAVLFGATPGTSITVVSATQLTVRSPAGTAGSTVDITVTTLSGTSSTSSADQFTYEAAPTVTALSPIAGPLAGGSTVVVTGTNFTDATAVKFGVTNATSFTVNSATQITAVSPAHVAGIVNVTVTTPVGVSANAVGNQFTYEAVPTITAIAPKAGLPVGGTSVVITGTNFTGASAVNFGGTSATSFTVNSATQITAVSPAGTQGSTIDITVTTPSGTSATSSLDQFTYEAVPTVTSLSLNAGPLAGGTTVVLTGTNFTAATAVKFGVTNATSFSVDSATQITAVSPAHVAGIINVTVTTPVGTSATGVANQFTYEAAPTVTSLAPNAGPLAGATSVVITGTNFTGASAVNFGGTSATSFTVNSATQITAVSPAGSAGAINVTVTTLSGTSATAAGNLFTYQDVPTITSISPNAGVPAGNTTVTVNGTNFLGTSAVLFGATPGTSITVVSATQLTVRSPAGTQGSTVDITVTTLSGTSSTSSADQFTYEALPTVTALSPIAGSLAGGTTVVLTGTNFIDATAVRFGVTNATSFTVNSATQITAVSPAGSAGIINVTVTTPVGVSAVAVGNQFTYEAVPTITAIAPKAGLPAGGTSVVITGTNFTGASAVNFGVTSATSFTVNSATQITAVSPAGTQGSTIDITVTTPSGTSATGSADQFTYEGVPTVTALSPNAGLPAGGASVVITGTNFTAATAVKFGVTNATSFTVNSATQITAVSPAVAASTVNVTVITPVGTSATGAGNQYTYEAVSTVTSLSAIAGPLAGGTSIVLTGTNFTGATAVKFGSTNATSFTVTSATQITAVSPAGSAGAINVTVITPSGTSATAAGNQFTYQDVPTITSISPNAGVPAGNTTVTVNGTNFLGTSAVLFGATPGTSITVISATQLTVRSPAGTQGSTVDITVTTLSGTSSTSSADQFTYEALPTVTALSPIAGPLAGGTTVVLTGTNFIDATAVRFGVTNATSFTVNSATQITAVSPAGSAGIINVTVTTPVGVSAVAVGNQFTYEAVPTITGIAPKAGLPAGGTSVVITGTNFTGASAVSFGATAAASFTVNSATQITAVSPAGTQGSTIDITVTTPSGTSATSSVDQFTYEGVPTVTALSPNAGLPAGGASVVITGTNFTAATAVKFGVTNATSFTINSATQITAVSPALGASTVNVTVITPVGTSATGAGNQYTYEGVPTVTVVSPNAGPLVGGTSVVLTGTNFTAATAVNFGGTSATSFTVNSATQITAVSPAKSAGAINVTVITPSGTSATAAGNQFTYQSIPAVTHISPNAGLPAGGTSVVITGTSFTSASAVHFGATNAASYTVNSATQITAVSPSGTQGTTIDITVTTPGGTSPTASADQFTYEGMPTITGMTPNSGVPAGGTTVVITGTNFTNTMGITFTAAFATSFTVDSPTQITLVTPPNAAGLSNVRVTTPVGTSVVIPAAQYMYEGPPTVTGLSVNAGLPAGGTSVVITGTNFTNATAVSFGSTSATSFTVNSATQITAISPAGTQGSMADITVTTPVGTSPTSSADQFTYEGPPTMTGITPNSGVLAGGTTVVITGTNFTNTLGISFAGVFATTYTINSPTQMTVVTPPGIGGTANVRVTTPVGTSGIAPQAQYTYEETPSVTNITPNAGLPAGGTSVVLTGTNFINATDVSFAGVSATSFTVNSATQITAVSPAGTQGSAADITVTTPVGISPISRADQFTYEGPPTITAITPNAGVPAGGTSMVITGTNFTNALAVSFASTFASSFTVDSPTQITVVTPAHDQGTVNLRVTTPVGTSVIVPEAQYTYEDAPTITAIFPNAGLPAGGTSVVITGTNFTNASAVYFGGVSASSFTVNNATQITAISPAGTQGSTADITVTTPVGTSATSANDQFAYEGPPAITGISPNAGLPAGGTTVVITGVNFTDDIAVNFGTTFATTFTVDSPTQITVVSPASISGTVNLRVTTPVGTSVIAPAARYTYEGVPTVTALSPNAGVPAGGTSVVITGTNFTNATAVNFGSTHATSFIINSATQITAVSPAGLGTIDLTVTTPVGTSVTSSADEFTYEEAPTVTGLSPNVGLPAGGGTIVITGTNFTDATAVNFGATPAASFTLDSATQITAVSPPGIGTVNVTVTTPLGTSVTASANQFTYEGTPTVDSLSPNLGPLVGGTNVVITGTNFTGTTDVKFGATSAATFTVDSATQITAVSPASSAGTTHVTVTTPLGTSITSSGNQFVYQGVPTITSISPNAGLPAGGTVVTVHGTNFLGASSVHFAGIAATNVTVISATQLTARSPAGTNGSTVDITVTTSSGTSSVSSADRFTYEGTPTITGMTPNSGVPAGGTTVVLTGTNFTNTMGITFTGLFASSFTVDSPTQITLVTPPNAAGPSNVRVTTPVGTSVIAPVAQYTYEEAPTVTGLSVTAGLPAGGSSVIITGTNFTNATDVHFGGNSATSFTVNSATQITAVSPAGTQGSSVDITVTTPVGTSPTSSVDQFVYEGAPTITGITPNSGVPAGGTTVVITGTNFTNTLGISFAATFASYTVDSPTQITVVTPPGTSGTVNVRVTTPVGTSIVIPAAQYTYEEAPTVTQVYPNAGLPAGGTNVVIIGTNFTNATEVDFSGTRAASFTVNSATQITAVSPAGTQGHMANITVTTPVGTSAISSEDEFTYEAPPAITGISPNAGVPAGGTTVVITGTNFTDDIAVNFGTVFATDFTVDSPTQVTVISPASAPGLANVRVTTPVGTSPLTPVARYAYENTPSVATVFPNAGLPSGGTTVVITGANFIHASAVHFGGTSATSFTVNSATQITAISPAGSQGTATDITVTTPVGTSPITSADQFVYEGLPVITGISPNAGLPAGGTTVVITGTNFTDDIAVNFGPTFATHFTVDSPTQITVTSPASAAGLANVRVTTPVGTSALTPVGQYIYETVPTVTSISPNLGLPAGGTSVVINGTNFAHATAVNFGPTLATSFTVHSATQITAISPAGSGIVDIIVTTPVGTSASSPADQFIYEGAPNITGISPNAGVPVGGTSVVITGTGFLDATGVNFGSNPATSFTVDSATQITAISPTGSKVDGVDITVITPLGTSPVTPAAQYAYEDPPTVTRILPNVGVPAGGNSVIITGTNFVHATAVNFGANPATSYTIDSATQITAISPPGLAHTTVHITVTTPVGTSITSPADQFTYDPPSISSISPNRGNPQGGTVVVIRGLDFNGILSVTFGGVPATSYVRDSATQITAVSPPGIAETTVDIQVFTVFGTSPITAADQFTYEVPDTAWPAKSGLKANNSLVTPAGVAMKLRTTKVRISQPDVESFLEPKSSPVTELMACVM